MKGQGKTCAEAVNGLPVQRFDALGVYDGASVAWSPGSLLVERRGRRGLILAAGRPADVDSHPASPRAELHTLPGSILIPGLVNAHTHLDLTHLGPRPFDPAGGFVSWVEMVRTGRQTEDERIAESVRRGIALSLAGGTVAVGDIAGAPRGRQTLVPYRELAASSLLGVSFLEFFGIGPRTETVRQRLEAVLADWPSKPDDVRLGLQPHAPNTVGLPLYEWTARTAAERAIPLATHLAETLEERDFIASGSGPQRRLLEDLGLWDDAILDFVGRGLDPVAHLAPILGLAPFISAHVNDADDRAIETLARTKTAVAYCPRASAYFGAERGFGPHRYRDMLAAGVTVALGTDSIVNLPDAAASETAGGISVLAEARFLHRRDGTDPRLLLRMATIHGATALGLDQGSFVFEPGRPLVGLVAIDLPPGPASAPPLARALATGNPPRLLFPEN